MGRIRRRLANVLGDWLFPLLVGVLACGWIVAISLGSAAWDSSVKKEQSRMVYVSTADQKIEYWEGSQIIRAFPCVISPSVPRGKQTISSGQLASWKNRQNVTYSPVLGPYTLDNGETYKPTFLGCDSLDQLEPGFIMVRKEDAKQLLNLTGASTVSLVIR